MFSRLPQTWSQMALRQTRLTSSKHILSPQHLRNLSLAPFMSSRSNFSTKISEQTRNIDSSPSISTNSESADIHTPTTNQNVQKLAESKNSIKSMPGEALTTNSESDTISPPQNFADFWKRFTAPRPEYPRWSKEWYLEMAYLCVMFAVTGSLALTIVRSIMNNILHIDASLFRGEWYERLLYFGIMFPTYSACTLVVGTAFGRHAYSKVLVNRMWSRWGKLGRFIVSFFKKN